MTGLCPLCGALSAGSYCYAHAWAAGTDDGMPLEAPRRTYADGWNAHAAHMAEAAASIVPSRPAGSSREVGSRSKSPAGRRLLTVESVVATNHPKERKTA